MVRVISKSLSELVNTVRESLQDGLIEVVQKITYDVNQSDYQLDGYSDDDPRIHQIISIEGIGSDGNYKEEGDLSEGDDYTLWNDYGTTKTVPLGYGNSSGDQLYTGITFTDTQFEDGSTVYIRYKYHSVDMLPILTDFSNMSVIRILLNAILSNHAEIFTTLYDTIDDFSINASGVALDNLASIVNLTRTSATQTTGEVYIQNYDSNDLSITNDFRFATLKGDSWITFQPDGDTPTIPASPDGGTTPGTGAVSVIATDEGTIGNVGTYSISTMFDDPELTSELSDVLYTVSNPPVVSGVFEDNYFDNGTNQETDDELRVRISDAFSTVRVASYNTLEKAATDIGFIGDAIAHDHYTKKGLPLYTNVVYVVSTSGSQLSSSSLTQVRDAINEVKPVSSVIIVRQAMPVYMTTDMTVYISEGFLSDTTDLESDLQSDIQGYIDGRNIGQDIIPASMLTLVNNDTRVFDVEIDEITMTEFVSEPFDFDSEMALITSGTEQNRVALELPFNSIVSQQDVQEYTGSNTFTMDNSPIDDRVPPRVFKAIRAYNGLWQRSPQNVTDFYSSNTETNIVINENEDTTDPIVNGDMLIFDYNYYGNQTIDGFRVRLKGDDGNTVRGEVYIGTGDLSSATPVAGTQVDVTLDGTEKMYEFEFDSPVTLSPASNKYHIFLSDQSGSGNSSVVTWAGYDYIPFNPDFMLDGQDEEASSNPPDGTYTAKFVRAQYESYTKYSDAKRYEKISIPNNAVEPEKSLTRTITFTYEQFEDN